MKLVPKTSCLVVKAGSSFGGEDNGQSLRGALEEEEVQPQRHLATPATPTQAEIDEHRDGGHVQYRNWCPECVEAFAREWAHNTGGERGLPLLSCDYLYVTHKGVFGREELTEEEREAALRVLVAYCKATKSLFAHAVPRKGADPAGYIVEALKQDVLWLGHSKLVIRSDNEPALLQVVRQVLAAIRMEGVDASDRFGREQLQDVEAELASSHDFACRGDARDRSD